MRIGVPGEFHEDRWQRTAEDSERSVLARTREAGGTHRIQVIAWQSVLLAGLRHGDPAHKYLSAILAWRRGLLDGLWHGNPAYRYLKGIYAWRDCLEPVSNRSLADAPAGLRHGNPAHKYFSANPAWQDCLEQVQNRSLADSRPIFGTAPPPTGTSGASSRGEGGF